MPGSRTVSSPAIDQDRAGPAIAEAAAVSRPVQPVPLHCSMSSGAEGSRCSAPLQHDAAGGHHTARYCRRAASSARRAAMLPDQTTAPFSTTNARCPARPSDGSTVAKITVQIARAPFVM